MVDVLYYYYCYWLHYLLLLLILAYYRSRFLIRPDYYSYISF